MNYRTRGSFECQIGFVLTLWQPEDVPIMSWEKAWGTALHLSLACLIHRVLALSRDFNRDRRSGPQSGPTTGRFEPPTTLHWATCAKSETGIARPFLDTRQA